MAKSKHPSRGGGGGKTKPVLPKPADEDDSFIVFSNSKTRTKAEIAIDNADKAKDARAGPQAPQAALEDAPKKPTNKQVVAGQSWTGKLPTALLSEHCQKQRWEKPEYSMRKDPEGYSSMVTLKCINPKTKEVTNIPPFKLPPSHKGLAVQPTAVEARNFAATYALFRVCSMRNLQLMLPPNHRGLWKGEFEELKKEDAKEGKAWMYAADPFATLREREELKIAVARKREEKEKLAAKQATRPGGLLASTGLQGASDGQHRGGNPMRGWEKVPKIDLGKRIRTQMESLIRKNAVWNPHAVQITDERKLHVVKEFSSLGFRKSHVEEAVAECKDREETLEWLLIHVPEDDLPPWSLPEGYTAGISMASGNLKKESIVKRLAAAGYASELCEKALDANDGDEGRAAEHLQRLLVTGDEGDQVEIAELSLEESQSDQWAEEQATLESIYGDRFHALSLDVCQVSIDVANSRQAFTLQVRKPTLRPYPQSMPVISILSEPLLPAYIRLSIIQKAAKHANVEFLGFQHVFNLIDWLEANIVNIIEHPGILRDVSAGASVIGEVFQKTDSRPRQKRRQLPRAIDWRPASSQSMAILREWEARQKTAAQQKMLSVRQNLPAWALKDEIIDVVHSHQVTIISGETGSGKSTQAVQFILDDLIRKQLGGSVNIICTQPRRISALGLADRVSDERCGIVGKEVGYAIRGESKQSPGVTKITFVTTGVLLRRLQTSGGSSDDVVASLADVSHVIVDEVHERSLDTDFLLVLLRDVLKKRKDLKVILMSATLDADVFVKYFTGKSEVGQVKIEGRTFPIDDYYLDDIVRKTKFQPRSNGYRDDRGERMDEDDPEIKGLDLSTAKVIQAIGGGISYDLISQTVKRLDYELGDKEGGILIFLPGTMEINKTLDALRNVPNLHALPLHASLLPAEQRKVFPRAPYGKRKVIAATNVAETSITIEDIVAVIDTGRVKETSFDTANNMVKLEEAWASRAACKQRRGRAGRVRAGKCYKLYTRHAEMTKMAERPEPEIRRVPLEQLCLSVKAMGILDVESFLASALTPPDVSAVKGAIRLLSRMGALDGNELTALGRHLSMVPADLRCGKLLVYGALFGCLDSCLTIAAILSVRSPFVSPQGKRDESKAARATFAQSQGDLIGDLRAYEEWVHMRTTSGGRDLRAWCDESYLSTHTLWDISSNRAQFLSSLRESGVVPSSALPMTYNSHNGNIALLCALIAAAFNPQIARIGFPDQKFAASVSGAVAVDPEARTIKYFSEENGRVFVHPSSTLFDAKGFSGGAVYVAYFNKMATSKVFIRDLTPFNAFTLLLFSSSIELDTMGRGLIVDGWLRLRGWARIGVLVSRLKGLLDDVLAKMIDEPGNLGAEEEVVGLVRRLVELDGMDRAWNRSTFHAPSIKPTMHSGWSSRRLPHHSSWTRPNPVHGREATSRIQEPDIFAAPPSPHWLALPQARDSTQGPRIHPSPTHTFTKRCARPATATLAQQLMQKATDAILADCHMANPVSHPTKRKSHPPPIPGEPKRVKKGSDTPSEASDAFQSSTSTTAQHRNAFAILMSSPQPKTPETPPPQKKPPDPFNRSNPANQWRYAFEHYITHPEDHPREVVYYNDNWVLIRDAYPKASVHLLLLTRNPDFWFIHPLTALQDPSFAAATRTQVTKGRRIAGSELRRLYGHESALENAKANLLSQGVNLAAEADASGGEDEAGEATMAMLGRDWETEVVVGVHAQPSMAHFHVHFISRDLHSPGLKNKKHYNSFQAPFFVGLERFWDGSEGGRNGQTEYEERTMDPAERERKEQEKREELRESVERRMREAPEYLKRDLICWKCGEGFGNRFAALKEHLEGEFERWKRI